MDEEILSPISFVESPTSFNFMDMFISSDSSPGRPIAVARRRKQRKVVSIFDISSPEYTDGCCSPENAPATSGGNGLNENGFADMPFSLTEEDQPEQQSSCDSTTSSSSSDDDSSSEASVEEAADWSAEVYHQPFSTNLREIFQRSADEQSMKISDDATSINSTPGTRHQNMISKPSVNNGGRSSNVNEEAKFVDIAEDDENETCASQRPVVENCLVFRPQMKIEIKEEKEEEEEDDDLIIGLPCRRKRQALSVIFRRKYRFFRDGYTKAENVRDERRRTTKSFSEVKFLAKIPSTRFLKCELCSFTCSGNVSLKQHLTKQHTRTRVYNCHECNEINSSRKGFLEHYQLHKYVSEHWCPLCASEKFSDFDELVKHLHTFHKNDKIGYKCETCDVMYTRITDFRSHIEEIHPTVNLFNCLNCSFKTNLKAAFNNHNKYCKDSEAFISPCFK